MPKRATDKLIKKPKPVQHVKTTKKKIVLFLVFEIVIVLTSLTIPFALRPDIVFGKLLEENTSITVWQTSSRRSRRLDCRAVYIDSAHPTVLKLRENGGSSVNFCAYTLFPTGSPSENHDLKQSILIDENNSINSIFSPSRSLGVVSTSTGYRTLIIAITALYCVFLVAHVYSITMLFSKPDQYRDLMNKSKIHFVGFVGFYLFILIGIPLTTVLFR